MQKILSDILKMDPWITIVGTARDGEEGIAKISALHPDVVTMDIEMPKMNGLTAVRKIMETNPVPVVMISALTQHEAQMTLKALEYGAVDYVPKPAGQISLNMDTVKDELISKIKTAASANAKRPGGEFILSPLHQFNGNGSIPSKNPLCPKRRKANLRRLHHRNL